MTVPPQHRRVYYLIILVIYTASVKSAMYSGRTSPLVVYSARRAVAKVNVGLERLQLRTGGRTVKTGSANIFERRARRGKRVWMATGGSFATL